MKSDEEKLCTICCTSICDQNYHPTGEITRKTLDTLGIKIKLNDLSLICGNCQAHLQKCVYFKTTFLYTEMCINQYRHQYIRSESKQANIEDVYKMIKTSQKLGDIPEGHKICRFCMKPTEEGSFTYLQGDEKDVAVIQIVTQKYIPQIVLTSIREPVICNSCKASFHTYLHFDRSSEDLKRMIKLNWLQLDVKQGREVTDDVHDLVKIEAVEVTDQTMSVETKIKFENVDDKNEEMTINTEFVDIPETVPEYVFIKNEPLELKSENTEFESIPGSSQVEALNDDGYANKNSTEIKWIKTEDNKTTAYKCDHCPYQGKFKRNLAQHMIIHKNTSQTTVFLCEQCGFNTKHRSSFAHHKSMHKPKLDVKIHKCNVCLYETTQKRYLKQHSLIHMNLAETKMYKCETCDFETPYKSNLNGHLRRVHKSLSDVKVHKCNSCPYVTKYKVNFNRHMLKHKHPSEVETLRCKMCPYETKLKGYYKQHLLVHKSSSEVMTYKCEKCPYTTKRKFCLKDHQVKHQTASEADMKQCTLCSFKTKYPGSLRRHSLVHKEHSETQMFECDHCMFETKYKKSFTRHMVLHNSQARTGQVGWSAIAEGSLSKGAP